MIAPELPGPKPAAYYEGRPGPAEGPAAYAPFERVATPTPHTIWLTATCKNCHGELLATIAGEDHGDHVDHHRWYHSDTAEEHCP